MRRGWPLLPPLLLLPALLLAVSQAPRTTEALAARRRSRSARGHGTGTASSPSFGAYGAYSGAAINVDELELLAQIADAPADDGKLTCFTCSNVTDNDQCNRYAIDRPCEPGLSLCRTDHVIERVPNSRARSVRISKSCVSASECSRAAVGCRGVAGDSTYLRLCTSCCDWSYCNELAPADTLTAVLALSRSGAGLPQPQPWPLAPLLLTVLAAVF